MKIGKKALRGAKKEMVGSILLVLLVSLFSAFAIADPVGPDSIAYTSNSTKAANAGVLVNISGGNISYMNLTITSQNNNWKAFIGEVVGAFTLDDAAGSTIYDWTLSTVNGEVYATRTSGSVAWGSIECANATNITSEESAMLHTGQDNISTTFNNTNTGTYVVAGTTITPGDCSSLYTYINSAYQESSFEEIILFDTANIVYATDIEEDVIGYNGAPYDFQMIVAENASETFTGSIAYYMYVELS